MKGQYKMLADMFGGILIVALCIAIFFLFIGYYVIIKGIIKSSEEERKTINLGHVLISSDKLVYSDEKKIYRGILDENKVKQIDSKELFNEISYPNYTYFIQIINSDTDESWTIGEKVDPHIVKVFPVAIKDGDEIQVGKLVVNLKEK